MRLSTKRNRWEGLKAQVRRLVFGHALFEVYNGLPGGDATYPADYVGLQVRIHEWIRDRDL